jgi:phospholipid/cholesterol/gamma-HCH transport system ATP-binding protein
MTVVENVAVSCMFGSERISQSDARTLAREYLDVVGLAAHADVYPSQLNLHQRHLLEFARALAAQPRVLFLDEVFAGLNPAEIETSATLIRSLHRDLDLTVVMVTHDLDTLFALSSRIAVLAEKHVIINGTPREGKTNGFFWLPW